MSSSIQLRERANEAMAELQDTMRVKKDYSYALSLLNDARMILDKYRKPHVNKSLDEAIESVSIEAVEADQNYNDRN